MPPPMKLLATLILCVNTSVAAQDIVRNSNAGFHHDTDTIFAQTQPVDGFKSLRHKIEEALSSGDTIGKKHEIRLNNIAFIVSKTGKIDSAWIIFHRRLIHYKIIKELKATPWMPAEKDGKPIASRQQLDLKVYLTKAVLKKHGYWPSLAERILAPWLN